MVSSVLWLARISQRGEVHRSPDSAKDVVQQRLHAREEGTPMPTECSADLFGFASVEGRRVEAGFDGGKISSDAGALLLGSADRAIGLVGRFAACVADRRCPELVEHG